MSGATINEQKKCLNIKDSPHFLFLYGQMHLYPSVFVHFYAIYLLKQYWDKTKQTCYK